MTLQGGGLVVQRCWVNCQCRGRFTNLDESRARPNSAYSRCQWGWFEPFFSRDGPIRLKYCLKGSLNPKQPPNRHYSLQKLNFRFVGVVGWCACPG